MSRSWCLALAVLLLLAALPSGAFASSSPDSGLDMYTLTTSGTAASLAAKGYDVVRSRAVGAGKSQIQVVLSPADRAALEGDGYHPVPWRNPDGHSVDQLARLQQERGYDVWSPFDGPGGLRQQMVEVAGDHPAIAAVRVLGRSVEGRDIMAVRVTRDVANVPDGSRPAVLYLSGQHAREWIGPETNRRLLELLVEGYGVDAEVTQLVDTRELWFLLVANPDGYEFTFTPGNRLWRKNLRDNDGDGWITDADGVDLNRNYPAHWGYDSLGSSPDPSSETYRGPSAASEPETVAVLDLLDRVRFTAVVNYHSVARLILYPVGWMDHARSADDGLFEALAGTPDRSAIPGYTPEPSWRLYLTNGEACDYAYGVRGALCFTVEMGDGDSGDGFVFPDDPVLVQREFVLNLPFALDMARAAPDPARFRSQLDITPQLLAVEPFAVSYGDPQPVEVAAARELGEVTLHWQVAGEPERTAPTSQWGGGRSYGAQEQAQFHWLRGTVAGVTPGQIVTVWFAAGTDTSDRFTYRLVSDSHARVLVLAEEDYRGTWPTYGDRDRPAYLQSYMSALATAGYAADAYDIDAQGVDDRGRVPPDVRGVLAHYDAVVWYTGDDRFTTDAPEGTGSAPVVDRSALETVLALRDYVNEGGKLVAAGARAGEQFAAGALVASDPSAACDPRDGSGCEQLSGRFFQEYLGGVDLMSGAGADADGTLFDVSGVREPLGGLRWAFGAPATGVPAEASAWVPTSRRPVAPGFHGDLGELVAGYEWPELTPHSGHWALYSDWESLGWTRLTRQVDLQGTASAELRLWAARDTTPDRGWMFVEAHTVGQDDWTTLADENGHTSSEVGDYCMQGVQDYVHPQLGHYMSVTWQGAQARCLPTGTTGRWSAASGRSSGWEAWRLDLGFFAGRSVEVAVSVLGSPRGSPGVYLDDVTLDVDGIADTTSFEDGTGDWLVAGPPDRSPAGAVGFLRAEESFLPAGPVVVTPATALCGFELGQIAAPAARSALLARLLAGLGVMPSGRSVYLPLASRSAVQ